MKTLLLPLVLACLWSALAPAQATAPSARLTGIVNLPGYKCALLESSDPRNPLMRPEAFILPEGGREQWVHLVKIGPDTVTVELKSGDSTAPLTLHLEAESGTPSSSSAGMAVVLEGAGLSQVLSLYQELTDRTALMPALPARLISIRAPAANKTEAAAAVAKALADAGFSVIPDGNKFVMVVPAGQSSLAVPHSAEIKSNSTEPVIDKGQVNFPAVDAFQVAMIYAELVGRHLDPSAGFPSHGLISFRTQTSLSKEELVYALDTLFRWQNIKLIPVGVDSLKAVPASEH